MSEHGPTPPPSPFPDIPPMLRPSEVPTIPRLPIGEGVMWLPPAPHPEADHGHGDDHAPAPKYKSKKHESAYTPNQDSFLATLNPEHGRHEPRSAVETLKKVGGKVLRGLKVLPPVESNPSFGPNQAFAQTSRGKLDLAGRTNAKYRASQEGLAAKLRDKVSTPTSERRIDRKSKAFNKVIGNIEKSRRPYAKVTDRVFRTAQIRRELAGESGVNESVEEVNKWMPGAEATGQLEARSVRRNRQPTTDERTLLKGMELEAAAQERFAVDHLEFESNFDNPEAYHAAKHTAVNDLIKMHLKSATAALEKKGGSRLLSPLNKKRNRAESQAHLQKVQELERYRSALQRYENQSTNPTSTLEVYAQALISDENGDHSDLEAQVRQEAQENESYLKMDKAVHGAMKRNFEHVEHGEHAHEHYGGEKFNFTKNQARRIGGATVAIAAAVVGNKLGVSGERMFHMWMQSWIAFEAANQYQFNKPNKRETLNRLGAAAIGGVLGALEGPIVNDVLAAGARGAIDLIKPLSDSIYQTVLGSKPGPSPGDWKEQYGEYWTNKQHK